MSDFTKSRLWQQIGGENNINVCERAVRRKPLRSSTSSMVSSSIGEKHRMIARWLRQKSVLVLLCL